jgi:hypothetical protein
VSKLKAIIDSAKRAGVDKSQPPPQMPDEAARQAIRPTEKTIDDFSNEDSFYRIVDEDAYIDLVNSGAVRTNFGNKPGSTIKDKLASRPTRYPSFSKGSANKTYAEGKPNHYIIETKDPSIKPSTEGRHGKGTTQFPTDSTGVHLESLPGEAVQVYRHIGDGQYRLVYDQGKVTPNATNAETKVAAPLGNISIPIAAAIAAGTMTPQEAQAGPVSKALAELAKRADAGDEAARQGIRGYHGSPYNFPPVRELEMPDGAVVYQSMDDAVPEGARVIKEHPLGRFDMSKIGTGEGAQAYGRGLYFAQAEDVGKGYRDQLSEGLGTVDGESIGGWAAEILDNSKGDPSALRARINMAPDDFWVMNFEEGIAAKDNLLGVVDRLESGVSTWRPGGHMYEVDIDANPDELLDWDKPLSEQSDFVREKLQALGVKDNKKAVGEYDDALFDALFNDSNRALPKTPVDLSGKHLYYRSAPDATDPADASKALKDIGIKGIRYKDGFSRGADNGTSNYVIFDDRLISIAKKYGVSIPIAAKIAEGIITPEEAQAVGFGPVVKKSLSDKTDEIQQGIGSLPAGDEMVTGGDLQFLMNKLVREQSVKQAKEQGYDLDNVMYHASKQDIEEFVPGYSDGLVFLTPNKEFANDWLGKGKFQERQGGTGSIEGVRAEKKRFMEEANNVLKSLPKDQRQQYFEEILNPQQQQLIKDERLADSAIYPVVTRTKKPFVPSKDVDVLEELYGKEYLDAPFGSGFPTYKDALKDGNYLLYENKEVVDFLKSKGYDSMFLKESSGADKPFTTLAVFDPNNIRSVNAKFDPEKKDSPQILASAPFATGITGLGAMAALPSEEAQAGVISIPTQGIRSLGQTLEFDPRFDPRKREQEGLQSLQFDFLPRNEAMIKPSLRLSDLEGEDFVTSMSDRTRAGGMIMGINGVPLYRAVDLRGGQDFMFENPNQVWASARVPSEKILEMAREFQGQSGKDPLFIPWRMAPTGGDFSNMVGELMLGFASSNMDKATKKAFDVAIREYKTKGSMDKGVRKNAGLKIKEWPGVDDPKAVEIWRSTPDAVRKELMNMMDVQFRNKGGLSIGSARLVASDPTQLMSRDAGLQNVGRIYTGQDITPSTHPSYPYAVPGEGIGTLKGADEVTIFDLLPEARFGDAQKKVKDPANPTQQEIRALQMKPYGGTITENILRRIEERGVNVNSLTGLTPGALAFTLTSAGLLTPEEAAAGGLDEAAEIFSGTKGASQGLVPFDKDIHTSRDVGLGGLSSEYTMTVDAPDGQVAVIPSIWWDTNGEPVVLDQRDAERRSFEYEQETGKQFPRFPAGGYELADEYAQARTRQGGASESPLASEYPSLGGMGVTSRATPDEVAFKAPREPRRIPEKQPPGIASLAGQLGLGAMSEIGGAILGGLSGVGEYVRGGGLLGVPVGAPATGESIRNINEGVSGYVGDLYDAGPEAQALGQQIMQGIGETIAPIAEYAMEGDITDEYGINMVPLIAQKLGIPLYELLERVYSMMPEREQEALKSGADAFL